jgi:hypothetical protein
VTLHAFALSRINRNTKKPTFVSKNGFGCWELGTPESLGTLLVYVKVSAFLLDRQLQGKLAWEILPAQSKQFGKLDRTL